MTEKPQNLFVNLGRPTLRGVRKCPKCGILNGTRGISCKNKECDMVFKAVINKSKILPQVDAAKIISCSSLQIYTVKQNDSVEDIRCFVLLPLIDGIESLQDEAEVTIIKRSAALCYAPECKRPIDNSCSISLNLDPCSHTTSVVNCTMETESLLLKKAVLKAMPVSEEIKQTICSLVAKPEEQLVQRVTKNTLVVKCHPSDLHPLGFLHFTVVEPVKSARKFRILCGCQTQYTKPFVPREKQMCLHFYMCVCAFASDTKLFDEFKPLVQSVFSIKFSDVIEEKLLLCDSETEISDLKEFFIDDISPPSKKKKYLDADGLFMLPQNEVKTLKRGNSPSKKLQTPETVSTPFITFDQWLASVTERINQTMHYQFSGCPEPLVFHVPQVFFDILQQRLSAGAKKKRLPNSVVSVNNKSSLPLGVHSKYTWHITNILHVKRIFDTTEIPLEITRSFIENRDGTFVPYQAIKEEDEDLAQNYRKTLNNLLIKPLELKTFLKVGNMSLDQKEPTPFIVQWTPDVLPKSHVGELIIKFEYGHERNGLIDNRLTSQVIAPDNAVAPSNM